MIYICLLLESILDSILRIATSNIRQEETRWTYEEYSSALRFWWSRTMSLNNF